MINLLEALFKEIFECPHCLKGVLEKTRESGFVVWRCNICKEVVSREG